MTFFINTQCFEKHGFEKQNQEHEIEHEKRNMTNEIVGINL